MASLKTPETVEVTVECSASGSYGIEIELVRHQAIVRRLHGAAADAGQLAVHDRITHVGRKGPLDHRGVIQALSQKPSPVKLTVVRGEQPPPYRPRPPPSRGWQFLQYALLAALAAAWVADANFADTLGSAAMSAVGWGGPAADGAGPKAAARDDASEGSPEHADQPPARRHPALKIGDATFTVDPDNGSPDDPDAMRAAMRRDKEMMRTLRKDKPEWARIITGFEDGSYDRAKFVKVMKENYAASQHANAVKQNDDGSAVDPVGFLRALKHDSSRSWLKHVKKHHRDVYDKIRPYSDEPDYETLQSFLRYQKRQSGEGDGHSAEPPPPPTPYDDVGSVQMSMRILTDEGEEKDLYQLMPKESEEEKWTFPPYMQCAACEAVAYQAAQTVADRLAKRYKDDLIGTVTLEALQDLCRDVGSWSQQYALVPTMKGVNTLKGPGITYTDTLKDAQDVMMAEQHSEQWGAKLAKECERHLLGADAPEEGDFAAMSMEATADGQPEKGAAVFRETLCSGEKQPCSAGAVAA
jgi:hypothetical protein